MIEVCLHENEKTQRMKKKKQRRWVHALSVARLDTRLWTATRERRKKVMEMIKISPSGVLKKLRTHELNTNARNGAKIRLLYTTRTSVSSARNQATSRLTAMRRRSMKNRRHPDHIWQTWQRNVSMLLLQDLKIPTEKLLMTRG